MENVYFYKGQTNILDKKDNDKKIEIIQQELLQIFDVQNLSFLFGAGCSSLVLDDTEKGIPTMAPMAKEYFEKILNDEERAYIKDTVKIDITTSPYNNNLEKFLEVLFSFRYLLECQDPSGSELETLNSFIDKTKEYIFDKCNIESDEVKNLYKSFYRKLVYRDNNLSKTNIFTTNYDLFNERALDQLGVIYSNGFSGVIERYFNPTIFNYAFAEQMDLSNSKWNVIDNFIYLYKLHGSLSWIEDENSEHIFKIKEVQDTSFTKNSAMIYPTPVKQNASFGSPYSDLFREFQKKLMINNNILITVGYSFSDEHINNLIYQALTIPTFRLIIIGSYEATNIQKLFNLNDPRIWIIGEKEDWSTIPVPLHFFSRFVDEMLPNIEQEKIEESVQQVIQTLLKKDIK